MPNRPEVDKADKKIFEKLDELTKPKDIKPYMWSRFIGNVFTMVFTSGGIGGVKRLLEEPVRIIEIKKVGYYDVTVLQADDPKALANWLQKNNYEFPSEATPILQGYVEKKWYFVAVKIDLALFQETEGLLEPIKLIFNSSEIIYPLKITSINQYSEKYDRRGIYIILYTIAPYKLQIEGNYGYQLLLKYANWLPKKLKNALNLNYTTTKYFLTKFSGRLSLEIMKKDIFSSKATDQKRYPHEDIIFFIILDKFILVIGLVPIILFVITLIYLLRCLIVKLEESKRKAYESHLKYCTSAALTAAITIFLGYLLSLFILIILGFICIIRIIFLDRHFKKPTPVQP